LIEEVFENFPLSKIQQISSFLNIGPDQRKDPLKDFSKLHEQTRNLGKKIFY